MLSSTRVNSTAVGSCCVRARSTTPGQFVSYHPESRSGGRVLDCCTRHLTNVLYLVPDKPYQVSPAVRCIRSAKPVNARVRELLVQTDHQVGAKTHRCGDGFVTLYVPPTQDYCTDAMQVTAGRGAAGLRCERCSVDARIIQPCYSNRHNYSTAVGTSGWYCERTQQRAQQICWTRCLLVYLPAVSACCAKLPFEISVAWPSRRRRMASTLRRGSNMKSSRSMSNDGGSRYSPGGTRVSMLPAFLVLRVASCVCRLSFVVLEAGFPKYRMWRFSILRPIIYVARRSILCRIAASRIWDPGRHLALGTATSQRRPATADPRKRRQESLASVMLKYFDCMLCILHKTSSQPATPQVQYLVGTTGHHVGCVTTPFFTFVCVVPSVNYPLVANIVRAVKVESESGVRALINHKLELDLWRAEDRLSLRTGKRHTERFRHVLCPALGFEGYVKYHRS